MSYFVTEPSSALAAAVTGVWTLDMPRRHRIERVLPMASVEIIVNLADDYLLTGPDEPGGGRPSPRVFSTGLRRELVRFENPPRIRHVCVQLPVFGPARFGVLPASSVGPVGGPLGARLGSIAERALAEDDEPDLESVLASVIAVLEESLRPETAADVTVRRAVAALAADPARPLRDLAEELDVSHKTLIARFRAVTGVTPSEVARLLLLHRLIENVLPVGPFPTWAELAAGGGFADQSHFIRTFKRYVGMTPSDYLGALRASSYGDQRFLGER